MRQRPRATLLGANVSSWTAAHNPVVYKFLRRDKSITSVVVGVDLQALVNVSVDLTADIAIGDPIFLQATNYSIGGKVLGVTATQVQTDIPYTSDSSGFGYINFRLNWRLEVDIFNRFDNSKIISNTIQYQSAPNGEVTIDFQQYLKAFLESKNEFGYDVDQMKDDLMSIGFYIKYNENYKGLAVTSIVDDILHPTFLTDSAKQIGEVYGQNMGEYVPFPELLVLEQINGPEELQGIIKGGDYLYGIGNDTTGTNPRIFKIDPVNKIQLSQSTVGSMLSDAVYVPTNEYVFATSDTTDDLCYRIEASTLDTVDTFALQNSPIAIEYCSSTDEVWAASRDVLDTFDVTTKTGNLTLSTPTIVDVVYIAELDKIYYNRNATTFHVLDPATGVEISSEPTTGNANPSRRMIPFKNTEGTFLAFTTTFGDVIIINAANGKQDSIYSIGGADCVTYDEETQYLYFHTSSQTLMEVDSVTRLTIQTFDLSALDPNVNEMLVSNRTIFFAERGNNAFYKLLPPPQLAKFLTKQSRAKVWRNYPFDLSFIFNQELSGSIVSRNVRQFDEINNQLSLTTTELDNTKSGFANRLLIGDIDSDAKKLEIYLSNDGEAPQYSRTDYDNTEYK